MDLGNIFKVDSWWKVILICGILLSGYSLIFDAKFIENKYVFGLGIGMTIVGVGCWMALKTVFKRIDEGMLRYNELAHTPLTKTITGFGIVLSLYFLIRILIVIV